MITNQYHLVDPVWIASSTFRVVPLSRELVFSIVFVKVSIISANENKLPRNVVEDFDFTKEFQCKAHHFVRQTRLQCV